MILAAQACALGLPGVRLLETTDQLESQVMRVLTDKAAEAWDYMSRKSGVDVANAVGKLLGG